MITKAMILAHAATVGLTCTAVQVAPPVYKAVKTRVQGHHRAVVPHQRKPRIAKPAPVCPPASGIATIGQMQNYTRPLVPIDTANGTSVEQVTKQEGYGHGPGRLDIFSHGGSVNNGGYSPVGGFVPTTPNAPVAQPTTKPTSALPEPGTWAMMLAGFGMVGFVARQTRRVAPATNLGE